MKLMIVGRGRKGDQNRRQPHRRQFSQRRSPGSTHGSARGSESQLHFSEKWADSTLYPGSGVGRSDLFFFGNPGEMENLQIGCSFENLWQSGNYQVVDPGGALTSPHDQQDWTIRGQPKRDSASRRVHWLKLGP